MSDIMQFRTFSLLSVEGKVFFKVLANRLTEYLLRNSYIDTPVQKGDVPGVPGCIEHTGVVTQLIREAKQTEETYQFCGSISPMPTDPFHKAGNNILDRIPRPREDPSAYPGLLWQFQVNIWEHNICMALAAKSHHHWLHHISGAVCCSNEHACQGSRSEMSRSSV